MKNREGVGGLAFLMLFILSSDASAADAFTTRFQNFISTTVITWTRIAAALAVIGGVCGLLYNRNHQEKHSAFYWTIGIGAAIFGIPEIINALFNAFASSTIDAFK